jgi:hypothetical protein
MEDKAKRFHIGKVQDFAKRKGWFFGSFMDEPTLRSDQVEVAWQNLSNVAPSPDQKHLHKRSVEINVILAGWIEITINGVQHMLSEGDFYVIWPYTTVEAISTGPDTQLMVVRAPSLPDDKFSVS